MKNKIIKIYQVFQEYSLLYQSYIPPVLEQLTEDDDFSLKIIAYKGNNRHKKNNILILPKYHFRRLQEKLFLLRHPSWTKLSYLCCKAIQENVDIIHIQHSFLFPKVIELLMKPSSERPKIVITLRGGDTYIKPWINTKWSNFFRDYGRKVDAFITMSHDQKKYLERWGVPKEKIFPIPISFGHTFEVEAKLPDDDKLKIISVFRMCWEKNIYRNLLLIKNLKDVGVSVRYDVYGDGSDLGQLLFLVDKLNLKDAVFYHGRKENEIIKSKLAESDFYLQLSTSESLGMSVIEAQSVGLPGIVSGNGGLPEVITHKVNGFIIHDDDDLIDITEEIVSIWKDKYRYKQMSESSIKCSHTRFSIESEVVKLKELYKKILDFGTK